MNKYLESLNFINDISLSIQDVTTEAEAQSGYKIVVVTYDYKGKSYTTKKLYYRNIIKQESVSNPVLIMRHYGKPVFWLDIEKHNWPHGTGAEIEQTVIDDMIEIDEDDFRKFLLSIANNNKSGHLQIVTREGKTQQYGYNLENNNHWHDIILLLQKIIKNGGNMPPKEAFINLVFNWGNKEPRERVKLDHTYKFIKDFAKSVRKYLPKFQEMELINILKYKKQIILQGPPGTGKTFSAKKIAEILTGLKKSINNLSESKIKSHIKAGMKLANASGKKDFYTVVDIDEKGVWLQSDTSRAWDASYVNIIKKYNELRAGQKPANVNGKNPYEIAVAQYLFKSHSNIVLDSTNNQVELIQFHPSYTYEDFVRGITVKNGDGQIEYITENKILVAFANKALRNYRDFNKGTEELSQEKWTREKFQEFVDEIQDKIEKDGKYDLNRHVFIFEVGEDSFRYTGSAWNSSTNGHSMKFEDLIIAYLNDLGSRKAINNSRLVSGSARQHATYYYYVLNRFLKFLSNKDAKKINTQKVELKNFVLIIDEINRANLSSVLGELVYALEYRGEGVESMYELDGARSIVLPPNLFIIGTMNTADRSVGHIDYAIRRRFAFVDVLPKVTVIKNEQAIRLFKDVAALFVKTDDNGELKNAGHLAPDFDYKDVQLGHSYFLLQADGDNSTEMDRKDELQLRLDYEIKPILREYLKDGILLESASAIIEDLRIV
ncbi:AAA family ATPase [Cochleicola gelatinilyticus]|nr:AAA family ATPase [Cochleicola gelatinilyticus]